MKQKLLSWLMIACLCIGVIPTYVLNTKAAEETTETVFSELTESDMQYQMNKLVEKGYQVVTPMTFGVADPETAGALTSTIGDVVSLEKKLFSVNLTYDNTGTVSFSYLNNDTKTSSAAFFIQLQYTANSSNIRLYNRVDYANSGAMYLGDTEDATSKTLTSYFSLNKSSFGLDSYYSNSPKLQIWITTEFVDMIYNDDDELTDDLKIGIWINGVLYKAVNGAEGSYFYVKDCKDLTFKEQIYCQNAKLKFSSPIMDLDHMGMVGGEYASEAGEAYTSDLVATKDMDTTTFQTSVRFEGEGGTLYYGSNNVENAVKLTSTSEGIKVSYGGETLGLITNENVGIDVLNNNFDLKLTTEIKDSDSDGSEDDVELDICVDNKHTSFTLADATLTAYVGVQTTGNATVLVGDLDENGPEQITKTVNEGGYCLTKANTMTRLSVDGVSVDEIALTDPGTYSVAYTDNGKVYMKDVTILDTFATVESQMPEGYRVVTPLTFGWADTAGSAVNPDTNVGDEISIDKLLFCADLTYDITGASAEDTGGTSLVYYLRGLRRSSGSTGTTLQMRFEKSGSAIYLWNTFDSKNTESMYVGDKEGATSKAYGEFLSLGRAKFGLTTFDDTPVQLWITTEFVDMEYNDNDDYKDDLKIGFYINGVLYGAVDGAEGSHFYVPNCKENVYSECFATSNARVTMSSPILEPGDMGMDGGEYASVDGEFYNSTTDATVADKDMDGTTFQSNVRFEGEGGTLYYGSSEEANAIKLTSTSKGIQVSRGEEDIVLLDETSVGIDVLNNNFLLKLTTNVLDSDSDGNTDDVELDICVDNKQKSFTLVDAAETLTATVGVKTTGDATILVGDFAEEQPKQVYWNLDNGAYTKATTDFVTRVSSNGTAQDSFELSTPGTYSVAETRNGKLHMEDVTVYSSYDLNGDEKVEIIDLVRMLKVEDETTHDATIADLSEVAKKAIGYKDETSWDATAEMGELVLDFMREEIVGEVAPAAKTSTVDAISLEQLLPNQGSHGAYTSDFTITASGLDFLNDVWLLTCDAKYISVNGKQPTIEYKIVDEDGAALYTSPAYVVGGENESILRQWRVTPIEQTHYNSLQINFVIPDGVALFIDEFYNTGKDNILAERTDSDIEYASHIGLRYAPGNTIPAFEWAGKMGFDRMITIVKFTSDGVPVCFHDDDTIRNSLRYKDGSRITSGSDDDQPISAFTYQDLTDRFSVGYKVDTKYNLYANETVPTLDEFFAICAEYDMDPIFSVHPSLTVEQWGVVKDLLETKYPELLGRLYVKTGALGAIEDAFSVLGFDIGGYQIIKSASSNSDSYTIAKKCGLVDASGEVNFDKVEAEFFNTDTDVQAWVEKAASQGFKRISLYCEDRFDGADFTRLMDLGVNEFNIDYHASIGLNW